MLAPRRTLAVHGALLLGALLPVARVLPAPASTVLGEPFTDVHKHVWSYWHTLTTVLEGTWPSTVYLDAPVGGVLHDVMMAPSLLLMPVTALFGAAFASNLFVVASLWLVGASTMWLAARVARGTSGPLTAGLLAQTSPYLLGYPLNSGVHERLAIWIYPLTALVLLRARDGDGRRWEPPALFVAMVFAVIGCQVYGLFLGIAVALAAPFLFGRPSVERVKRLLPSLLAIAAALSVCLLTARVLSGHPENIVPQVEGRLDTAFGVVPFLADGANPAQLLFPWAVADQRPIEVVDRIWCIAYVGLVPLVAVLAGVLREGRRWGPVRVLAGLGLVMTLLSIGPRFEVAGRGFWSPPFHALAAVVPFYGGTPPVWQQAGFFPVICGVGVAALVAGTRAWVGPLVLALALAERALVLPVPIVVPTTPLVVSPVLDAIDDEGLVLPLPRAWQNTLLASPGAFRGQIAHGRPTPMNIELASSSFGDWLPYLRGFAFDYDDAVRCMARAGFRWVLVDEEAYGEDRFRHDLGRALERATGGATASDERYSLYDLDVLGLPAETLRIDPLPQLTVELARLGLLGKLDFAGRGDIGLHATCPLDADAAPTFPSAPVRPGPPP